MKMQREEGLEGTFFSEDLLTYMCFKKRDLPGDLACLVTGNYEVYSLGSNIYFLERTPYGYRFKRGFNLKEK